jgi:hypothetical protein
MEDREKSRERLLHEISEVRQALVTSQQGEATSKIDRNFLAGIIDMMPSHW